MTDNSVQDAVPPLADIAFPSEIVTKCPFPFYAALRREAPVFRDAAGGGYFVSRRTDIIFVLAHPELFSSEGYRGDSRLVDDPREILGLEDPELPACPLTTPFNMSLSDPPEHSIKRRAASPLVHREHLEQAAPAIREIAEELIDAFAGDGAVEFRAQFAAPMALLTICHLAGFPREDREIFRSWVMTSTHGRLFMDDAGLSTLRDDAHAQMEYCRGLILERLARPCGDFLSGFVAAGVDRDGGLNLPYLISELRLLLAAGNETTQRLLTNTMLLLLRHPDAIERVRADRSLVPAALEESLRLESPTQWVSRLCVADTVLGGVAIPAGSFVLLLYGSANRDETWGRPDAFDLDRPDVQKYHLAFGGGLHRCLGAPIARLESQIALNTVLDRLVDLRLGNHGPDEIENIDNLQKRVPRALPITFRAV
jgi:cytochrome P450